MAPILHQVLGSLSHYLHPRWFSRRISGCHQHDGVSSGTIAGPKDLLIISCGIRPRDELARTCELELGERGKGLSLRGDDLREKKSTTSCLRYMGVSKNNGTPKTPQNDHF